MVWVIIIILQLLLWWVTFFKSKRRIKRVEELDRHPYRKIEWVTTNERYKFPLGLVVITFLLCFLPILGFGLPLIMTINSGCQREDRDFEEERPVFFLVELGKKRI